MEQLEDFLKAARALRRHGSAPLDLCSVAAGRFEGYWEPKLSPWDLAASLVLVPEAGGVVTDKYATPASLRSESIIASGGVLHGRFLKATDGLPWRQ